MKRLLLVIALLLFRPASAETPSGVSIEGARGSVALPGDAYVDGIRLSEISGLAWDADEQVLHAVSDSGHLLRLRLRIEDGWLREVIPLSAVALRKPGTGPDRSPAIDAEGLALHLTPGGGTELLVATEGSPSVLRVNLAGVVLDEVALPADLADARRYEARNTMLEAVAVHPLHGVLVAPERPLRGEDPRDGHRIRSGARHWNIEALDPAGSRLKAMDVTEDGHLLVLERAGSGKKLVNAIRRVDLNACQGAAACAAQTLLRIDPGEGAENFEGMAYLGDRQVLLVSDNRSKKRAATVFLLVSTK